MASMPRITRVESFVYRAPIAVPIRTSFGAMPNRPAVFVRVEDSDGAFGWGEIWANFPAAGAEYRARLFDAVIAPKLLGQALSDDPGRFWSETDSALHVQSLQTGEPGAFSAVLAGADIALHDLAARRAKKPLWQYLGGDDGSPVPAYASGINPGPAAYELVQAARERGFRAFKIKIGVNEASDLATLQPVAEAMKVGELLMVDINQGWTVTEACHMARTLQRFPLAWIEEPLPADRPAAEWARVKASARAPLAGGENLRGFSSFDEAIVDGNLSILQPDMCKWGGVSGAMKVAQAFIAAGRTYCPHFLGGGVGLMASLHLLGAVRGPGRVETDVNPNPLREDLVQGQLNLMVGAVPLPEAPGIGIDPDLTPFLAMQTLHTEATA
jgi:D-galactarolactone cycloisomerase